MNTQYTWNSNVAMGTTWRRQIEKNVVQTCITICKMQTAYTHKPNRKKMNRIMINLCHFIFKHIRMQWMMAREMRLSHILSSPTTSVSNSLNIHGVRDFSWFTYNFSGFKIYTIFNVYAKTFAVQFNENCVRMNII